MRRAVSYAILPALVSSLLLAGCGGKGGPPRAPVRPVTDTYWGVKVVDDYRYMENADDPEVKTWVDAEDAFTREWIDEYPERETIAARTRELLGADSPDYKRIVYAGNRIFAVKSQPPKQQAFLVLLSSLCSRP